MIGYIKGKVLNINNGVALVVNNGIGYEIACSQTTLDKIDGENEVEIFTYLAVREDGLFLYGFSSVEEKKMFIKLISVSGVGPKIGIAILSGMALNDLAIKIATSDIKGLSKIKGLGKKMAERIVVELREKMQAVEEETETAIKSSAKDMSDVEEDAIIALMSLGFTKKECLPVVLSARDFGAKTVEEIVTYSLKNIR